MNPFSGNGAFFLFAIRLLPSCDRCSNERIRVRVKKSAKLMISDTAFSQKVLLFGKSLCSKAVSKLIATCKGCTNDRGSVKVDLKCFSAPRNVSYVPVFIEGTAISVLR